MFHVTEVSGSGTLVSFVKREISCRRELYVGKGLRIIWNTVATFIGWRIATPRQLLRGDEFQELHMFTLSDSKRVTGISVTRSRQLCEDSCVWLRSCDVSGYCSPGSCG